MTPDDTTPPSAPSAEPAQLVADLIEASFRYEQSCRYGDSESARDAFSARFAALHTAVVARLSSRSAEDRSDTERPKIDQRPNGCWAACVATITGISLDELDQNIPADASEDWFWEHKTELHNDMVQKLRACGWRLDCTYRDAPRGFAIASGKSPRLDTVQHACVYLDGDLWHDPHPSRAGLESVESFEILIPLAKNGYPIDAARTASPRESHE